LQKTFISIFSGRSCTTELSVLSRLRMKGAVSFFNPDFSR
jgi:hypothetical protein